MSGDLLQTKLYVPQRPISRQRHILISRPRLIKKLNAGRGGKLTLFCAPAGYGKTTLATDWLSQLPLQTRPAAWLSLDAGDNDLTRFLAYCVAALQTVEPGVGETAVAMRQSAQPQPIEAVLTSLINDLVQIDSPFLLVLDDYHHISAQPVHNALAYLIENMPPHMHLVIISRSDPPLPLSRLRARGQMTEIRQADLRFTAVEAASFLNDVMGLSLTVEQVNMLEARTEGWIAGMQMAALSMRSRDDKADFIAAFSGSHRFVMDYLADEVLRQQDEETRHFLYQTAILDRLTAPLCDVLTGRQDSQAVLDRLEQDNLFIVPLDDERQWYRYHHLFADLLRQHRGEPLPVETTELHRRAAAWYEEQQFTDATINHWLAGADPAQAARLIEARWLTTLNRGEMATVAGWLDTLSAKIVQERPWLSIARAWTALLTGQVTAVEPALQAAATAIQENESADNPVLGHMLTIRAYVSLLTGDVSTASQLARKALARLPEDDRSTRSIVAFTLGGTCLVNDDLAGARRAFTDAAAAAKAAGNVHLAAPALCALGTLQMQYGALHQALATFNEAQQIARTKSRRDLPVAAGAYSGKGQLLYEWGDLLAATEHLETAVTLAQQWGNIDSLLSGQTLLVQAYLAQDNDDDALAQLQQATQLAKGKQLTPSTDAFLAAGQIRAWLAVGNVVSARRCAEDCRLATTDELSYLREGEHIALARLLMAESQWEQSEAFLQRLHQAAEAGKRLRPMIEILVLLAVAQQAQGNEETAVTTLIQALELAEPEGYVRTFVDAGSTIQTLLEQAAARGVSPEYTTRLLAAFPAAAQRVTSRQQTSGAALVEPLSEHELKVLRLVAAGLTNRETAVELYLSVNTVKWHLKNIYDKLDVHGRVEAIARAQEIGYL